MPATDHLAKDVMNAHDSSATDRLARGLGWASLGIGAPLLAAPRAVRRLAGVDDSATARTVVPLVGGRELLHGAVLLSTRRPGPWVWTRVAGDAMDLTALGRALAARRGERRRRAAVVTAAVAAIAAADLATAVAALRAKRPPAEPQALDLHASITINRARPEVYRFWHDIANLPQFMAHLESVEPLGDGRSHWKAKGPARRTVEWDAEIVEERSDEVIVWRSTDRTPVGNAGAVHFADAPGGRGTELHVELTFDPPGGRAGAAVAKLLGEHPAQQVRDDLRRLKQVLEAGEVVRSEGSPEGTRAIRQLRQRPAQPLGA
jgi:uncharacterized membrane protein